MITINFCNMTFTCDKAIKGSDYIHLVDADGKLTACFEGVSDFNKFNITGGFWTAAPSNDDCEIAVVGAGGVIRKSTKKASDIASLQTDVSSNTGTIASLQTDVSSNKSAIASLRGNVSSNNSAIATLQTDVGRNKSAIASLQTDVSSNKSAIAALPERWNLLWEGAASEGTTISISDADKYNVFAITYNPGSDNYHTVLAVRGRASEALIEGSGSWAFTWTNESITYLGVALFSCTFSVESASRWTIQQSRLISLDMRDKVGDKTESELFSSGKKNIEAIYGVA